MASPAVLRRRLAAVAPVGVGTLVLGGSAYVFLGAAGHSLTPRDYTTVASLYLLAAITGPGVFIAVEQELNREVSGRLAVGAGTGAVRRGGAVVAALLAAAVVVVLLALSPLLVPGVLGGSWALLGAVVLATVGAAAVYAVRGLLAGERRYGWYATSLTAEGAARIIPSVVLVLVGATSAVLFGFAFAVGTGIAALLCLVALRRVEPGPPLDVRGATRATVMLAFASGLTYVVANVAPLVLTSRLLDRPEVAASYVSLFVLARIPVFLFSPLQAFLLPPLTAAAKVGDAPRLRAHVRFVAVVVAAFGVAIAVVTGLLGPWAVRAFFNAQVDLPHLAAALLGLSTVAMLAAQTLQPALVSVGAHRAATTAWFTGAGVFAVALVLPVDPVIGSIAAQLSAPLVVVGVMAVAFRRALRALPSA